MGTPFTVLVIGAHPDDCEIKTGGMAARWAADGHRVCLCSVTDGRSGHHAVPPADLAARRRDEAAAAAAVIGAESLVLDEPDGALMPSLEARAKVIRTIRRVAPDLVITHRPNDYHPDHRYTSQLVQDAAFSVQVPHIVPDTPALAHNPVIAYMSDDFTKPTPFAPDVVVRIDDVHEAHLDLLHAHASQFYEWLPHLAGDADSVPGDDRARRAWLGERMHPRLHAITRRYGDHLARRYGADAAVIYSEAYEGCEYGSPLDAAARERFFGGY